MKIAVNKEVAIPISNVVAKPFIILILILTVVWIAKTDFSMRCAIVYPEHPTSQIM